MLISGSFALQFLNRLYYPESDLDIYVNWRYVAEIIRWIQGEGYVFQPQEDIPGETIDSALMRLAQDTPVLPPTTMLMEALQIEDYTTMGLCMVFNFENDSKVISPAKVQIITAARTPIEIILQYHSSKS